jgi:hypothetical protein
MEVSGQIYSPDASSQEKGPLDTLWIGGRVGRKAGLNAADLRKISSSVENRTLTFHPVARRYND